MATKSKVMSMEIKDMFENMSNREDRRNNKKLINKLVQEAQCDLDFPMRVWVYGVIIDRLINGVWRKFVKFGVHRCNTYEDAMKYAANQTEGKTRGLTNDDKIIVCEDVTEKAKEADPGYLTGEKAAFDNFMRPDMPGKHRIFSNDQGGTSTELHEHDASIPDDVIKDEWRVAVVKFKEGKVTPINRVYTARPYLNEFDIKLQKRPAKMLLGATTGAGKETSTLAIFIREHDIGYGTRYHYNSLHVASATIPSTALELIEELSNVAGMTLDTGYVNFERFKVYVMKSFKDTYYSGLKNRARYWFDNNVTVVSNVSEIPSHNNQETVPVLLGSFIDIGLGKDGNLKQKYNTLKHRIGILAIGEAHQFLSKEKNKIWTNVQKALDYKFLLPITGTPYDFIFNEDRVMFFEESERVLFTRNDLYKAKAAGDASYQKYPWMHYYALTSLFNDVVSKMKENPKWADDANGFTWNKFHTYCDKTKKFKYQDLLITFYRRLFGVADEFTGIPDGLSIRQAKNLCDFAKRHVLVALPPGLDGVSINVILPALKELLTKNGAMGVYVPLVAYEEDLKDIKESIESDDYCTATFTCIKHLTGANIPNWGSFVMLRNIGDSVKFFEQATGRIIRPAEGKPKLNVGVFIGDLGNAINITITVDEKMSMEKGENKSYIDIVKESVGNYFFFGDNNGQWDGIPDIDIMKLAEEASFKGQYGLSLCLKDTTPPKEFDTFFKDMFASVRSKASLGDAANKGAKNSRQQRTEQLAFEFMAMTEDKQKAWWRNMIKRHLSKMRWMCWTHDFETLKDCANAIANALQTGNEDLLAEIGAGAEWISLYIDSQVDHRYANQWISKIKSSSLTDLELFKLTEDSELRDSQTGFVASNFEFASELALSALWPKRLDKDITLYDPAAGRGPLLIAALKIAAKYDIDLRPENVYYNDIDPANVSFFRKMNSIFDYGIPDSNIVCKDAVKNSALWA